MKKIISVTFMLIVVSWVFGTKIYLMDGRMIQGSIYGKLDNKIIILQDESVEYYGIKLSEIYKVIASNHIEITDQVKKMENYQNNDQVANYIDLPQAKIKNPRIIPQTIKAYSYKLDPKFVFLSISLVALSWDYFATASDINKVIADYKEMDLPTTRLEKEKNRKKILGTTFAVSAIFTTVLSFEKVEVIASLTSVSLGYRF